MNLNCLLIIRINIINCFKLTHSSANYNLLLHIGFLINIIFYQIFPFKVLNSNILIAIKAVTCLIKLLKFYSQAHPMNY